MKQKKKYFESGITLIALVITIIVLLILSAVTINMLVGDNGILKQATSAKTTTTLSTAKEDLRLEWNNQLAQSYYDDNKENIGKPNIESIINAIEQKGYQIKQTGSSSKYDIRDIEDVFVKPGETKKIEINLKKDFTEKTYYMFIENKYYQILYDNNEITLSGEGLEKIEEGDNDIDESSIVIRVETLDNQENYATVNYDDGSKEITIIGNKEGSFKIQINAQIGEQTLIKTTNISISDITLNYTWTELAEVSKAISKDLNIKNTSSTATEVVNGKSYTISIGDIGKVTYTNLEGKTDTYKVRVLGFNQDELAENYDGYGDYAGISFEFIETIEKDVKMNNEGTNSGGWAAKDLYANMNGENAIYSKMGDLSGVIKKVNKSYVNGYTTRVIQKSPAYLWLLSSSEIFSDAAANYPILAEEGKQYAYYSSGSGNNRKKAKDTQEYRGWWLRTPDLYFNNRFAWVSDGGSCYQVSADSTCDLAPGFSI